MSRLFHISHVSSVLNLLSSVVRTGHWCPVLLLCVKLHSICTVLVPQKDAGPSHHPHGLCVWQFGQKHKHKQKAGSHFVGGHLSSSVVIPNWTGWYPWSLTMWWSRVPLFIYFIFEQCNISNKYINILAHLTRTSLTTYFTLIWCQNIIKMMGLLLV